jgi:hypothetical protein
MTTEQLLTKIREFATDNYCSCEGRIHDPENLMEKLLKECEKWEKEAKKKNCQHDWAYDVPDLPRLRVCQLCGRKERREIIGISYGGLPDFSEWIPIIGDMDKAEPPKLRKGQKCWLCKKEIKGAWCYNGHWWHEKCMDKETAKRIKQYLRDN